LKHMEYCELSSLLNV